MVPKTLVMFDVDGTLTESFDLDSATYLDALRETFGFNDVSDDWASYRNVTDAGILAEVFEARLGRLPTSDETRRMKIRFAALLVARIDAAGSVRPVAGAAALLARLSETPDEYAVAYASGGWGVTARLKLRSAGLPVEGIPGAFADDDVSREGICRAAHRRAEAQHRCELRTVVYVGDGGVGRADLASIRLRIYRGWPRCGCRSLAVRRRGRGVARLSGGGGVLRRGSQRGGYGVAGFDSMRGNSGVGALTR